MEIINFIISGFKSEWAVVKDDLLYVGSVGHEYTNPKGELVNTDPQWIKVISPRGEVKSVFWASNYNKLREAAGIKFPGKFIVNYSLYFYK